MVLLDLSRGIGSELYRGLGNVRMRNLPSPPHVICSIVPTLFSLVLSAKRAIVGL